MRYTRTVRPSNTVCDCGAEFRHQEALPVRCTCGRLLSPGMHHARTFAHAPHAHQAKHCQLGDLLSHTTHSSHKTHRSYCRFDGPAPGARR